MEFTCPHCGNNSFKIRSEADCPIARCIKCGEDTAFARTEMTAPPPKGRRPTGMYSKRVH